MLDTTQLSHQKGQPLLNVPTVITVLAVVMLAIQLVRDYLDPDSAVEVLALFAFIPARYDPSVFAEGVLPGGWGADLWTFVTYAFLHGGWTHVGLNLLWLLAFGSPVARRFGTVRFLLFFAVTAAAGAGLHLLTHEGEVVPVIGASASVSGCMAAAIRFMFASEAHVPWGADMYSQSVNYPAAPLTVVMRDRRVLAFVVVWFLINLGVGLAGTSGMVDGSVAWEAHIGGFLVGLLMFPLFDPVGRTPGPGPYADRRV
ncbi:rhomboid family intramembrane serine protease [Ancylobacter pratisalsi]|uniref:Rhomboid family intramembrane serine protease n=1 Tax=Ancylobacter pratisalsi TaxID=1745854 RepID=A0A6P1YTK6_9HYPH|nr:rhomboid family intramembrane serine protease [Ancylobacter pratisalsi]QIB36375.1 rhomboid family intramembrane serine protease [Ancylobacter pratisalsi]